VPGSIAPGTKLGPYEIVSAIGAGGMGQVYRARDIRLERDVAVKVLPESFAIDPDRRVRFEREAKAVAALTHPNIVSLFDTGTQIRDDGSPVHFVVMELLDGETLRDRLRAAPAASGGGAPRALKNGGLPLRKAIDIAIQIARGLSAAHDKQLVHRDLKPENVFLTRDGQVKILDFGIAKGFFRESTEGGAAATETAAAATDPGSVVGTAGYMAPEQVRGQAVDSRTDLFALGAVLYEMLCGRRAFSGETAAETMTAILREDPPEVLTMRADAPPALDRILHHCLEKNPGERFQTARDVAFALEALSGSGTAPSAKVAAPPPPRRRFRTIGVTAAALALVAAGVVGARLLWPPEPMTQWSGVALGGPAFAQIPRISPDGRTLAFLAMVGRNTEVAVMTPDSGDWAVRTSKRAGGGYVTDISWSPRGDTIYYGLNAAVPMGVFSIPSVGGSPQLVLPDACAPVALADGSLLVTRVDAAHQYRLYQLWPDTGRLKEFPIILPRFGQATRAFSDGQAAVLVGKLTSDTASSGFHLYVLDVGSGATRRVATDADEAGIARAVAITPDGQGIIAAVTAGHLTRVVRFARDGRTAPQTLFTVTRQVWSLDVGPDSSIYIDQTTQPLSTWRFAVSGGRGESLGTVEFPPDCCATAEVLPDGRVIVPGVPGANFRLLITEPGKDPRTLIATEESTAPMTLVGDGEIAFLAGSRANRRIALASIATGRVTKRVEFGKGDVDSLAATRDGKTLYIAAGGTIWAQPIAGGEPRAIRGGSSAAITPDGRRLLVQAIETPKSRLFDVPLDGGKEREILLNGPYALTFDALNSRSISRDDRLTVPLASPDDWYFLPGVIDLKTGRMTAIPVDEFADYHFVLWGPGDKSIIAGGYPTRYALWRFQMEKR
jgi:eukaryotic-like serine/threonine-protein kinase